MSRRPVRPVRTVTAAAAALAAVGALTATAASAAPVSPRVPAQPHRAARHVLLLSIDGLHQSDLAWYTARNPHSALARLAAGGVEYTHARTTNPSDSFPGMVGQLTGGNPGTTGVYYDDAYSSALLPAGTTKCAGARPGAEVDLTEDLDRNKDSLDAGQGLSGLPGSILKMTGDPARLIDPSKLPVDPRTCKPVYPHAYLKVNTVFDVARKAGLRTAWSDKHAAYEILDGHSGDGIQDLFTPEINSTALGYPAGDDWTKDNAATEQYDGYKVRAVLNQIDGYDHSGSHRVGTPAVFGMNFQSVSTAQKLPSSDGLAGGYRTKGVPGPLLAKNLAFVDRQVGAFLTELRRRHLDSSTTVILSAKHGQSPIDPKALTRIDDGPLLDGLNAAWKAAHPGSGDLVAHAVDDDAMLLWLTDRSQAAADFARTYLLARSGTGNGIDGQARPFTASGLTALYAGAGAARYFHAAPGDSRVPDLVGVTREGVVYTGGKGKIAEHGGAHADDLDVPLVVSGAATPHGVRVGGAVRTTQIAPTILRLLGLDPRALDAVRVERTRALPVR
ncbi:alkaline phosphatase family protein [Streptomyces sp. NPDC006739]|uniref:alkaline phosphatase family protein n=1 Tax=Streptomyces sp. NPDC006739 TaxID=3364763 RepID=UPI003681D895